MTSRSTHAPEPAGIAVRRVAKSFGTTPVLRDLDLDVPAGRVTAVLGASGSGKTTLLRLIAGFDAPDAGRIDLGSRTVAEAGRGLSPRRRSIGYVPQDAVLFPHLTVAGNIGFGVPRAQRRARVTDLLDLVGLPGYERKNPHELSGGQRQRVALARALAIRPRVVLLDEPFSSLDVALRETVRHEVLGILDRTGTTVVLVTHDQDEALSLADHVAVLHGGGIAGSGTPAELYRQPRSIDVASAIGTAIVLPADLDRDGAVVRCELGCVPVDVAGETPPGGPCEILLRPEQLRLSDEASRGATRVSVTGIRFHGHDTVLEVRGAGPGGTLPALTARTGGPTTLRVGDDAWLTVAGRAHVLAR